LNYWSIDNSNTVCKNIEVGTSVFYRISNSRLAKTTLQMTSQRESQSGRWSFKNNADAI